MFQHPVYVVLPHCTSRASAMTREPVIKAFSWTNGWHELRTEETTLDGYKVSVTSRRTAGTNCVLKRRPSIAAR